MEGSPSSLCEACNIPYNYRYSISTKSGGGSQAWESITSNWTMPAFKPIMDWWITFQPALLRRSLGRSRMKKAHGSKMYRSREKHQMIHQLELSMSTTAVSIQSDQVWSEATRVQCQRHLRCYMCSDHLSQRKLQLSLHQQLLLNPGSQTWNNMRSIKDKKSGSKRPRAKHLDPEDQGICILMSLIVTIVIFIHMTVLSCRNSTWCSKWYAQQFTWRRK